MTGGTVTLHTACCADEGRTCRERCLLLQSRQLDPGHLGREASKLNVPLSLRFRFWPAARTRWPSCDDELSRTSLSARPVLCINIAGVSSLAFFFGERLFKTF